MIDYQALFQDAIKSTYFKSMTALRKLKDDIEDKDVIEYFETLDIMKNDFGLYKMVMWNVHKEDVTECALDPMSEEFYKIVTNELSGMLEREGTEWKELGVYHYGLGRSLLGLAILVSEGIIRKDQCKGILRELFEPIWIGVALEDYITHSKSGFFEDENEDELQAIVTEVLKNNAKIVEEYRSGKEKVLGSLIGQIMKKKKADPSKVTEMLKATIKEMP